MLPKLSLPPSALQGLSAQIPQVATVQVHPSPAGGRSLTSSDPSSWQEPQGVGISLGCTLQMKDSCRMCLLGLCDLAHKHVDTG